MSTRALKFLQMAGESLSHLEALRTIHLQQTKSVFSGISNRNITGCTRYSFSTTSSAWYGLEELIPKSPSLPVAPAEEETTTSSGETREKIAQQHQTSNATVVGQAWSAELLRKKSWDDLHFLWISLYKEKNALYAEKLAWKKVGYRMPQATRFSKVKLSMNRIKQVMSERMRQEEDPKMRQYIKAFINAM